MPFLSGERIAFSYLTSQKFTGDVVALDILREGKPLQLQIKVRRKGGRGGACGLLGGQGGWLAGSFAVCPCCMLPAAGCLLTHPCPPPPPPRYRLACS